MIRTLASTWPWPWPAFRVREVAVEPPHLLRAFEAEQLAVMLERVGLGEVGGNNRGPHVRAVTLGHEGANWCAAEVADCGVEAAGRISDRIGRPFRVPYPTDWDGRRGAARMLRNVAEIGGWIDEPHPGCHGAIWRPGELWSAHHFLIVEDLGSQICRTVEANVGRFPAVVQILTRDFSRERKALRCRSFFASVAV